MDQWEGFYFLKKWKCAPIPEDDPVEVCPMEGFWGILKRERYYGRRFTSREDLVQMIENYIAYYNNRRVQRNLGVLTPMEKHYSYPLAA